MEVLQMTVLALSTAADVLACGYAAGSARIRIPFLSAFLSALVSSAVLAAGFALSGHIGTLLGDKTRFVSFGILAFFGLGKLATRGEANGDGNLDRSLSALEGALLGVSLSPDGFAAGISSYVNAGYAAYTVLLSLFLGCAALILGAKSGTKSQGGTACHIVAGIALCILAALKLTA